ncbi:Gfo/Idh/MocA family protein [Allostreptomyces psammosilenae]|uniref:Putative dehydrogenase n=1 Tax=Allostreptomyces psammosilenae TaxID=1892865 RepID=A0A852ZMR0_9ACTN|nr:Gfo/Idh/MocA family oxidoreductase [Allostreptomyces psammosilenae]NYI03689.1 putative dehydrogenase [Allostreptomyces psammosilenae]
MTTTPLTPGTPAGFRTIPGDEPLRVVLVGAGAMGRAWLATLAASPLVRLAGIVDLDEGAARRAAEKVARRAAEKTAGTATAGASLAGAAPGEPIVTGTSLTEVAARCGAQAVVDVTVPAAHLPVTLEALSLGLPVLGEKPLAATLAEAVALVDAADRAGELFVVSQNRRFNRHLWQLRAGLAGLGPIGVLTTEFFRAPRFGGFRDAMAHPLILDMAVHSFDAARFLLDADPVAVYCEEHNPPWSWYAGDAAATAVFEMTGGARYTYTGSWCSDGRATSWNGAWRASAARGSATWDGENAPVLEVVDAPDAPADGLASVDGVPLPTPAAPPAQPPAEDLAGPLTLFVHALRTGTLPMGECHDNLMSLAMVHAAIASSTSGTRVHVADVLTRAREEAADLVAG